MERPSEDRWGTGRLSEAARDHTASIEAPAPQQVQIALRAYQMKMVADIRAAFTRSRRVIAVAPTGAGKTILFAFIVMRAAARGKRVLILAHRAEIVEQISRALDAMGLRHGRIMPGHSMTDDPVQVAMVQTLARRIERVPAPDIVVADEAHHAVAGSWKRILAAWPGARILGVTATPTRMDGRGLDGCFDEMVRGPAMADLIEAGFLARYTYLAPPQQADLSAIRTRAGDFAVDELVEAMDHATITGDAIAHYRTYLDGRPAIVFCASVAHAEHVAEQFRAAGYRAASVDGAMDRAERRDRIAAIGDDRLNVLTSCEIVSEGVDIPIVSGAILLRPTKSVALYLQQVGRALRPKQDGSRAIILDHVGNVHRHGVPDAPREWSLSANKKKHQDAPPITVCGQCFRAFQVRARWKAEETCNQDQPAGCILDSPAGQGVREAPEIVPGKLSVVTNVKPWSDGIDIVTARGRDWYRLLLLAESEAKLREIAQARGFKRGWVYHTIRDRAARFTA